MERFDSVFEALQEVKRLSKEMDTHDNIYFAYNDYRERYFVTDDKDELSEEIHELWRDSGCDSKPENEADSYKVWEYALAEKKEKYPNTYSKAKNCLMKTEQPLIRRKKWVECEYSVDFVIPY